MSRVRVVLVEDNEVFREALELMLGMRKLAGSAQWRAEGALLQHGSILTHDDQSSLVDLMVDAIPRGGIAPPATLSEALGQVPSPAQFADALASAVHEMEGVRPRSLELTDDVRARTAALVVRYSDESWTWRR